MRRRHSLKAVLPLAIAATLAGTSALPVTAPETPVPEVLDPAAIAASACRPKRLSGPSVWALLEGMAIVRVARAEDAAPLPPLHEGLGPRRLTITTANPQAQRYFDEGFAWNNGFYHAEAIRYFRAAQRLDPTCAMCFWGEALAFGPNINVPMMPDAEAPALAAIAKAQALAASATPREQALIAALAQRYAAGGDRATLDRAYADAMRKVAADHPDDPDVAALFVEALMDLQPWDYWEADRRTPKAGAGEAIAATERVLAAEPDHAAALHLYIHLMEASVHAGKAEAAADRLGPLMATSGHLVHMPAHIYYKVGRYADSVTANLAAAAADEAVLAANGERGLYGSLYYPHNVHFVMVSALMAGDRDTTLAAADKLRTLIDPAIERLAPPLQAIQMAPYFAYALLADRDAIMALPDPGDEFVLTKAGWHYARGVALAQAGDAAGAQAEAEAIAALGKDPTIEALVAWYVPAPSILQIAWHMVHARVAQQAGRLDEAERQLRAAATLQDGLAYMEPPYWYYPVRQTLGAVLLASGRGDEAAEAFMQSLVEAPSSVWSLWGLQQAQAKAGDGAAAEATGRLLERARAPNAVEPALERL